MKTKNKGVPPTDIHERIQMVVERLENQGLSSATQAAELVQSAYSCGMSDGLSGVALSDLVITEINETVAWLQHARNLIGWGALR